MATHILRLASTSHPNTHLLVQVKQTGEDSLNLKLVGTEQDHLYHATIQDANISALQANTGEDSVEWREILKHVFLHDRGSTDALHGLETVAAINGQTLTITIRKNIGGITQKLGSIRLDQDDEREEVAPFNWVDTAVANADKIRTQLETLQASVRSQQDHVSKLSHQLEELVQAKKDHESELVKKFAALLNEKKLKIRDQQRLLNSAKVSSSVAEATSDARRDGKGKARGSNSSRNGKRKAQVEDDDGEEMDLEESEAFEHQVEGEGRQGETPPRSDAGDETEDDDLDAPASPVTLLEKGGRDDTMDVEFDDEFPPKRELPSKKKDAAPATSARTAAVQADNDDDDETDDEL